jgi:hypothetical protein
MLVLTIWFHEYRPAKTQNPGTIIIAIRYKVSANYTIGDSCHPSVPGI